MKKSVKYLFEILIIFISVMLAFLTEQWRQNIIEKEDFVQIMNEIRQNIRQDSIEFTLDQKGIINQINAIDRLLLTDDLNPDSITFYFSPLLYYWWPEYKNTGITQFMNSKNIVPPDDSLINEINDYYSFLSYMNSIHPSLWVTQAESLRNYLIENDLPPPGERPELPYKLTAKETSRYLKALESPDLKNRLRHLKANRLHQLFIWNQCLERSKRVLNLYRQRVL